MSEYLVKRLEEHPNIEIIPSTDVVALHGEAHLAGLTYSCRETGDEALCDCGFLFLFLGASPNTSWLPKEMVHDERGSVKTVHDLATPEVGKAGCAEHGESKGSVREWQYRGISVAEGE